MIRLHAMCGTCICAFVPAVCGPQRRRPRGGERGWRTQLAECRGSVQGDRSGPQPSTPLCVRTPRRPAAGRSWDSRAGRLSSSCRRPDPRVRRETDVVSARGSTLDPGNFTPEGPLRAMAWRRRRACCCSATLGRRRPGRETTTGSAHTRDGMSSSPLPPRRRRRGRRRHGTTR